MVLKIGERIRYLRDKAGMTQTDLARRLDISRSAVNSWEMSLSCPSTANILQMLDIFHVNADYLLSSSDAMFIDISKLGSKEQELVLQLVQCLSNKKESRKR